jgi:hypothetical protein
MRKARGIPLAAHALLRAAAELEASVADDAVNFPRTPYKITYRDLQGELKTIKRTPPPKLHDALPTDIVELTHTKNADYQAGDKLEVVGISPRQPNVLQVKNGDGQVTFIDYYDAKLDREVAPRNGVDPRDRPVNNKYLLWP